MKNIIRSTLNKLFTFACEEEINKRARMQANELSHHFQQEEYKRRDEYKNIEAESMVNTPVIIMSNSNSNLVVGFVVRIEYITQGRCPVPIVHDYISGEQFLHMGVVMDYTHQRLDALMRLLPQERWALVMKIGHYEWDFSKLEKDPEEEEILNYEVIRTRLKQNGFFEKVDHFMEQMKHEKDNSDNDGQ